MAVDLTTLLNFVLALIVAILGFWVYKVKENLLALFVALAFVLFAISHLAILLGTSSASISIIVIRSLAYLVIIYALVREALRR